MADDDEVFDETSLDPMAPAPGLRRSTFTPPVTPAEALPPLVQPPANQPWAPQSEIHDDDELAGALAADFSRVTTGTITLPPASAVAPTAIPTPTAPPADSSPVPTGSMFEPAGPPEPQIQRPIRRSLPDDQLLQWVDEAGRQPGATLNVIRELEAQLTLREEEAREFRQWEATMLASGNPDAIAAVEQARPEFTGVLPDVAVPAAGAPHGGAPQPNAPIDPTLPAPHPDQVGSGVPDEAPVVDPEPPVPPFTFPVAEPLGAGPLPSAFEPPLLAEPAPAQFDNEFVPDLEADTIQPPLPVWDISAPSPGWSPAPDGFGTETGTETGTGTGADAGTDAGTATAADPFAPATAAAEAPVYSERATFDPPVASNPSVTSDPPVSWDPPDGVEPPADAGPPPLVEPPLHGPAVLPSQVATPGSGLPGSGLPGSGLPGHGDSTIPLDPEAFAVPIEPVLGQTPPVAQQSLPLDSFSFDDLLGGASGDAAVAGAAIDAVALPLDLASLPAPAIGSIQAVGLAPPAGFGPPPEMASPDGAVEPSPLERSPVEGLASKPTESADPAYLVVPVDSALAPDSVESDAPFDRQRVFSLEQSGLEPTPVDQRVGRAARLFWLWFASNSSILSIGLGAAIFALGVSLRQAIVGVLAGLALSVIPLSVTSLAGKRSGQPTMVVSRATFGLVGNVIPALLAVVTRLFWGAVLLWLLASSVAVVLVGAGVNGAVGERQLLLISLAAAFLVALLVAFAGYPFVARIQLIVSIASGALIVGLVVLTWHYVNIGVALTTQDGPWLLTISGAVLVFSFIGLVWSTSGADLARYQRPGSSGAASAAWASFGTTVPTLVLIAYGALLAASDPGIASGFLLSPLDTLARMLPGWYPIPLLAATGLSLLSGVVLSLYSGGFALQAVGLRVQRQWSIVILAFPLGILALVLTFGLTGGINQLFRDAATTLAVPTAAWVGIFGAETLIRKRRYNSGSLLRLGGIYPAVRWVNLLGLLVASAIGYGLTTATVSWLSWQGYLFGPLKVAADSELAASDFGVLVALGVGILIPVIAGIPAIRRQESADADSEQPAE